MVDVRRCEELEKTFSKLGSGPRSRLPSWKETGQTWSEGKYLSYPGGRERQGVQAEPTRAAAGVCRVSLL